MVKSVVLRVLGSVAFANIDKRAVGELVPMPTLPPRKLATVGLLCVDEAT